MQEYRWNFRNDAAQIVASDRGRFLTDTDAVDWAVRLLQESSIGTTVEIWRDARLIGRRRAVGRDSDATSDTPGP